MERSAVANLLLDYAPRRQFVPFHYRRQRFACIVTHRRAGKTVAYIHDLHRGARKCEKLRPRFAYMPFAAGPRHCIGETLALYEMYMHLYKVARRYRLTFVPDRPLELEAHINLRTKHPLMMKLERRN